MIVNILTIKWYKFLEEGEEWEEDREKEKRKKLIYLNRNFMKANLLCNSKIHLQNLKELLTYKLYLSDMNLLKENQEI